MEMWKRKEHRSYYGVLRYERQRQREGRPGRLWIVDCDSRAFLMATRYMNNTLSIGENTSSNNSFQITIPTFLSDLTTNGKGGDVGVFVLHVLKCCCYGNGKVQGAMRSRS